MAEINILAVNAESQIAGFIVKAIVDVFTILVIPLLKK